MNTEKKEDFINPIEINVENKNIEDGLNNEEHPSTPLIGGDDEEGLPSIQRKKDTQKDSNDEPNYEEEIPSPKAEIENPHVKTIIKKIVDEEAGGDKVDIDFPRGITKDSTGIQPTDEYLEN
jgi:hypothetical protein